MGAVTLEEHSIARDLTLAQLMATLKNSIVEESRNRGVLLRFIDDAHVAIEKKDYVEVLRLLDDLEEFMDLEFCN